MWVKIADEFPNHPKLIEVGPLGAWLQVQAMCYCAKYLTDGRLTEAQAGALIRTLGDATVDWAALMVNVRLWDKTDDGYSVHDYLKYNPTEEKYREIQDIKAAAGRLGGLAKGKHGAKHDAKQKSSKSLPVSVSVSVSDPVPDPVTVSHGTPKPPQAGALDVTALVIRDLNQRTGKAFREDAPATLKAVAALLKAGYTAAQMVKINENMVGKWARDMKMRQFIRPETLYRVSHAESYINTVVTLADTGRLSENGAAAVETLQRWGAKQKAKEEAENAAK